MYKRPSKPKQTTISLQPKRFISNKNSRTTNTDILRWNNWVEQYQYLKQTFLVNSSLYMCNILPTLEDKKEPQIQDVPFIESEQYDLWSNYEEVEEDQNSVNSVFTQDDRIQEESKNMNSDDSENFTDKQEEENNENCKTQEKSTNKNSSVINYWLDGSQNSSEEVNSLKQTACFYENIQPYSHKQNINLNNTKIEALKKSLDEKAEERRKMRKAIKEDQKFLGSMIRKKGIPN